MSGTYTQYIPDELVREIKDRSIKMEAAMLACRLNAFADEKGAIFVSFSFLAKLWDVDERKLVKAAKLLDTMKIWHYNKGDGRGHVTEWIKGAEFATFVTLKRVQNLQIKGSEFAPLLHNNKDTIKIVVKKRACAREQQTKSNFNNAGETPAPHEVMNTFNKFWNAFFFGSYSRYEKDQLAFKERAQAVWALMPEDVRARCLQDVKSNIRYDKTHYVLYFLQRYKIPLQIWYAGDTALTPDMVGRLQVLKYKNRVAYVLPEDKDAWIKKGAKMFNN